jgi:hypothetical protein
MEEIEINAENRRTANRYLPPGKWRVVQVEFLTGELYTYTFVGTRTRFSNKVGAW